jgi:hypothetical protein
MTKINNWSLILISDNPYQAPELRSSAIVGTVVVDNKTKYIRTSSVVQSLGTIIKTRSGTLYELGEASEEYKKYLVDNGYSFDADCPLKNWQS